MGKKRPFPLVQQNEAEMFQQAIINNNFNPSSGGLNYKYELHFKRHLDDDNENASDKLGHNDFCTIGIWEGH